MKTSELITFGALGLLAYFWLANRSGRTPAVALPSETLGPPPTPAASLLEEPLDAALQRDLDEAWRNRAWAWYEFFEGGVPDDPTYPSMAWYALDPDTSKIYRVSAKGEIPPRTAPPEAWL